MDKKSLGVRELDSRGVSKVGETKRRKIIFQSVKSVDKKVLMSGVLVFGCQGVEMTPLFYYF